MDLTKFRSDHSVDPLAPPPQAVSTGSVVLDAITGIGGLPRGRVMKVFGPESSGKSSAMYQAIAGFQRIGGVAVLLDYEASFIPSYVKALGGDLDVSKLLVEEPPSLEDGFKLALQVTEEAAKSKVPLLVVFDSLAAMPMESETDREKMSEGGGIVLNEHNMIGAWRARAIDNVLRNSQGLMKRSGAVWVFINHEKDVIATNPMQQRAIQHGGVSSKRTPGGRAVKFYSAVRLQFRAGQKLKGSVVDPITGEVKEGFNATKATITAVKNKVAPPFRTAEVVIRYGQGIDDTFSVFQIALARGMVTKSGAHFTIPDLGQYHGADAALRALAENEEVYESLRARVVSAVESTYAVPSQQDDDESD